MRKSLLAAICLLLLPPAMARGGEVNWQDVSLDLPQPELGMPFPDLKLPDTGGVSVTLGIYRGKPLLIAFCSCYSDTACSVLKALEKISLAYGDDIKTVIICCEVASSWKQENYDSLLRRTKDVVDVVLIDEGAKTRVPYLVGSYPTTYLVDGDFVLRYRGKTTAVLYGEEFRKELTQLIGDKSAIR